MQIANCLVAIGGDAGNTVPKYNVTAGEIAVLRAIHGESAVLDIDPKGEINRSNNEELGRLRANYGNARDTENNSIVNVLFPGVGARVFQTIDELEIDETFFKPTSRATTAPAAPVAEPFAGKGDHDDDGKTGGAAPAVPEPDGLEALTVPKLKELAAARNIDLGDATKKADIIEAIEAATPVEDIPDEPGEGDMPDAKDSLFK